MIRVLHGSGRVVLGTIAVASLASLSSAEDSSLPRFQFLRQNEDWSVLATGDSLTGWNRVKYVPLSDDRKSWASFGGTLRWRSESWKNFGFSQLENDVFSLGRLLAHGDFHLGSRLRLFAEMKAAVATDRDLPGEERPIDVDTFDLQQVFVDVHWPGRMSRKVTLRVGRQALSYGRQRLVSPLPWANSLRSWDGVGVRYSGETWVVDSFATYFDPVESHALNETDSDRPFFGVYASRRTPGLVVEAYGLGLGRTDVTFNETTGDESRYTLGTRLARAREKLGLEFEAAVQFGEVGSDEIRAWMATFELTRPFPGVGTAPRLVVALDYASGDDSPGGRVGTFNQLYPLGHAWLGIMDFVGRQNVAAANVGVDLGPWKNARLALRLHAFGRAQVEDALYNAGAIVIRQGGPETSRDTGTEFDAVLKHSFSEHLVLEGGGGYFRPGRFIEQTGPSDDMTFVYVQVEYRI